MQAESKTEANDQDERQRRCDDARERFLKAVGHRPEDHRPNGLWDLPEDIEERARVLRKMGNVGCDRADCAWWWCVTPEEVRGERGWSDLLAAFEALKANEREFDGPIAASIAMAHNGAQLWREQVDHTERLEKVLETFDAPEGSDAAFLKAEFLERLRPLLALGVHAQGRGEKSGRRIDRAIEQALDAGERHGWRPQEVAAMLLVVGVERSNWDALREIVRKAENRRKLRKPLAP